MLDPSLDALFVGEEWIVDARGCDPARLADAPALAVLLRRAIVELELQVLSEAWHSFPAAAPAGPPGGVTGFYLLTESHLACHTYPESGVATFNLYCCRPRPEWPWADRLASAIGATSVTVRRVARGGER